MVQAVIIEPADSIQLTQFFWKFQVLFEPYWLGAGPSGTLSKQPIYPFFTTLAASTSKTIGRTLSPCWNAKSEFNYSLPLFF